MTLRTTIPLLQVQDFVFWWPGWKRIATSLTPVCRHVIEHMDNHLYVSWFLPAVVRHFRDRRNRAGRHKTGCPSLRHRKKVYRTSYTLVERCLTRTSQISFESTSNVNHDKLITKALFKFPNSSPITFTAGKLEKDNAVALPKGYSG